MCLLLTCNTRLEAKARPVKFSHHIMHGWRKNKPSSDIRELTHCNSKGPLAKAWYSDYVDHRETTFCFIEVHEIRLSPKNTQIPTVEHRSSTSMAQSASLKVVRLRDLHGLMCRAKWCVPFKYRKILLTPWKWTLVDEERNWLSLFTEYVLPRMSWSSIEAIQ